MSPHNWLLAIAGGCVMLVLAFRIICRALDRDR